MCVSELFWWKYFPINWNNIDRDIFTKPSCSNNTLGEYWKNWYDWIDWPLEHCSKIVNWIFQRESMSKNNKRKDHHEISSGINLIVKLNEIDLKRWFKSWLIWWWESRQLKWMKFHKMHNSPRVSILPLLLYNVYKGSTGVTLYQTDNHLTIMTVWSLWWPWTWKIPLIPMYRRVVRSVPQQDLQVWGEHMSGWGRGVWISMSTLNNHIPLHHLPSDQQVRFKIRVKQCLLQMGLMEDDSARILSIQTMGWKDFCSLKSSALYFLWDIVSVFVVSV